jgi:hypothetical protein
MLRPINGQLVKGIVTKKLILFEEKELETDLVIMNNKQISWDVDQCTGTVCSIGTLTNVHFQSQKFLTMQVEMHY